MKSLTLKSFTASLMLLTMGLSAPAQATTTPAQVQPAIFYAGQAAAMTPVDIGGSFYIGPGTNPYYDGQPYGYYMQPYGYYVQPYGGYYYSPPGYNYYYIQPPSSHYYVRPFGGHYHWEHGHHYHWYGGWGLGNWFHGGHRGHEGHEGHEGHGNHHHD